MTRCIIVAILFCNMALCYSAQPDVRGDYAKLQGRWIVFRCERDSAIMPERNGRVFIYEGTTVHLDTDKGRENYVLHEDTTPKSVDFVDGQNPPVLGIYKLEGDTLVTCTADPGLKRPLLSVPDRETAGF
jgi:uncharacterized protein (TIGR03067 family)